MKYSICIIMHKLGLFRKKLNTKVYNYFNNLSKETLKEVLYPKNFIVILDEDENYYIQNMLIKALKRENKKVIYNKKIEDDLTNFLLKSSNTLSFIIESDYLVLTVNKKSLKSIDFKYVKYFLINDINQNYSYKNPDEEVVIKEVLSNINYKTNLILNIDNPYVNFLKHMHKGKSIGYGLKQRSVKSLNKDYLFKCPVCHENLTYKSRYFQGFGSYICPNNDFETGIKTFEVEKINLDEHYFKLDGNNYKLNSNYLYDIYFLLGFYSLSNSLNIDLKIISSVISEFSNFHKTVEINNVKYNLFEAFNGNVLDYQKKIDFIGKSNKPFIIGFSKILDCSLTDSSWLYKINFRPLSKLKDVFIFFDDAMMLEVRLKLDEVKCRDYNKISGDGEVNVLMPKNDLKKFVEVLK